MPTIDYFFTSASPFVYLGHRALMETAARNGARVAFRPVSIAGIWEVSGSVPLAQRSATRQRYRVIELQRIAEMRGLPLNTRPKFFPVDPALADRCAIALVERGEDPSAFMWRVFASVWAREEDIADPQHVGALLEEEGHDAVAVFEMAQSPDVGAVYARNTADAAAADAIGVPTYVLDGEPFWGQDRIDLLDRALATGRPPFRAG